jgi:hypothetical protein
MPRIVFHDTQLSSLPLDMDVRRGVYNLQLAMDVVYIPIPASEAWHRRTGDYYVARADNRRILGLLERQRDLLDRVKGKRWEVRAYSVAFKGDHFDDEGDCLDEVPTDLSQWRRSQYAPLDISTNRDEGALYLLQYLYKKQAPAMGFGRHRDVRRHESPYRSGNPITRRTMLAGPFNTVESRDEWDLPVYTVPDGATPLRLDTPNQPKPKLTKTQQAILINARIDHGRVWRERARGNVTSLRKLHELGYLEDPEYGTRLTTTGHETARQLILKGD